MCSSPAAEVTVNEIRRNYGVMYVGCQCFWCFWIGVIDGLIGRSKMCCLDSTTPTFGGFSIFVFVIFDNIFYNITPLVFLSIEWLLRRYWLTRCQNHPGSSALKKFGHRKIALFPFLVAQTANLFGAWLDCVFHG